MTSDKTLAYHFTSKKKIITRVVTFEFTKETQVQVDTVSKKKKLLLSTGPKKVFFFIEFTPWGNTINAQFYCETLEKLQRTIHNRRRGQGSVFRQNTYWTDQFKQILKWLSQVLSINILPKRVLNGWFESTKIRRNVNFGVRSFWLLHNAILFFIYLNYLFISAIEQFRYLSVAYKSTYYTKNKM